MLLFPRNVCRSRSNFFSRVKKALHTLLLTKSLCRTLLEACTQLKHSHGLFLFADRTVLEKDPFSEVWRRGKSSGTTGILDLPKMASHPVF